MNRWQKMTDGLFDFVIRVSSEDGKKSEAEVAILPQIVELISRNVLPNPSSQNVESD